MKDQHNVALRRVALSLAGAASVVALSVVSIAPASAASFNWGACSQYPNGGPYRGTPSNPGPHAGYSDASDTFYLDSMYDAVVITARLSPVTAGRGPSVTYSQSGGSWYSWNDLARAYEDTLYNVTVTCRYGDGPTYTWSTRFYS